MRAILPVLVFCLTTAPAVVAQTTRYAEEAPAGANFIADARHRRYYPIGCELLLTVPLADRLYYATESAVQRDGYARTTACPGADAGAVEDVRPRLQDGQNAAAQTQAAHAQPSNKHARRGFWFSGGLGYGSLGCEDCTDREDGLSGGIALGGSLSQKVLLGVGTNGWSKSEGDVTLTVGTMAALIRFYPSATGGFFLLGGLGLGTIHAKVDGFGSDSETGVGAVVGLGYDIRVGSNVSLTPFWNGFATETSNADANVGQLGLSVTLH
jgi:outer membrane protein with beta-barrel domain